MNRETDPLQQATSEIVQANRPNGPPETLVASTVDALRRRSNDRDATIRLDASWRKKLKSIAKLSGMAATIALIFGLAVTQFGASRVALADAADAIENMRFWSCKLVEINKNTEGVSDVEEVRQQRTLYFDLQERISRTETHYGLAEGPFVTVQSARLGKRIMLNPENQTALLTIDEPDEDAAELRHPFETVLSSPNATLSHKKLDGVEHVYVHCTDTNNGVQGTTRMWLDRDTLLPVKAEYALPDLKLWYTYSDFEWALEFDDPEALFSLEAPAGYDVTVEGSLSTAG